MVNTKTFTKILKANLLGPIIEVPCSYLKHLFDYIWDSGVIEIINPVNEALAMGIASGYYISSGKIPIIAIQNSGLLNTLNALTSLNQIYHIPLFYLITWRGEQGKGFDAPEHDLVGANLQNILKVFDIPYQIIDEKKYATQVKKLKNIAEQIHKPVALIVRKNTFIPYKRKSVKNNSDYGMTRYGAISVIKTITRDKALFISSTGFPTRDSYNIYDSPDFYMVGSMGHAFSLALGISPQTHKKIIIFDGDGGALMHLGGLASFDPKKYKNIIYIILDNQKYESTGGQPTVSNKIDFMLLAKAFNFKQRFDINEKLNLKKSILYALKTKNSSFFHICINNTQGDIGRRVSDSYSCVQIKERFMKEFIK